MIYRMSSKAKYLLLLLLFSIVPMAQATVVWTSNFTPDVVDDNLILGVSNITLDHQEVLIRALTTDVVVTMTSGDVVVNGFSGGNSVLGVQAATGFTVTFEMTNNLTFQGSVIGSPAPVDLTIIVVGGGQVIFNVDGGKTLTLTRNLSGGAGGTVQMFVRQSDSALTPNGAFLSFQFSGTNPNSNVGVTLQNGALLTYAGFTAQPNAPTYQTATINWNVVNSGNTGRMILTIGDTAAVIVRARLVTDLDFFTQADIDPAIPAGYAAIFQTTTNSSGGSLLIQNYNNTLGEFIWDPWGNLDVRQDPPFGNFSGIQYGFIVGSYGQLNIGTFSYLDYVGLTGTQCPNPSIDCASSCVKARSASALFTDGQPSPFFLPPEINIAATAGLFFRSGVDNQGNINPITGPNPFTINPCNRTPGAGIPVFDIEGPLLITGANTTLAQLSAFELLSLEVNPTGGPLFVGGSETIFPLRTFTTVPGTDPCTGKDETVYLSYNNACFLNNGRVNLCSVSWLHTDQNHHVFENNDVCSEPAYIGGETWKFFPCIAKPKWAFANSRFNVQMSVALTGVDLLVPENSFCTPSCTDNLSMFVFYENGYAIDDGNGRNMILGTFIGSTACDGCSVINKDAQLDVMQTSTCVNGASVLHELVLSTTQNDNTIVQAIPAGANLINQYSIQTIYLGNNSNISVGTEGSVGTSMEVTVTMQYNFPLTTHPELLINGNFFSFETRGGQNGLPATSNVTGQGGIFVDTNGTIAIGSQVCGYRTNIGAMVTQSANGIVDLPKNRVFFDPTIGIATWNINLNDPNQVVIIPAGVSLSDYNLNWMFIKKDYDLFTPYAVNCYDICNTPTVTTANVTDIPTIEGSVQQLQVQGSRIGDPAHIKISGGIVQELVMLVGFNSAEAPVAVLVLEDSAEVGLGSTHRNVDSLNASVQLGVNGINIILNGDKATVNLNEDVIINNTCSILPGPDITADAVLTFYSDHGTTLRVTKDGILDLSLFATGQTIQFAGNIRVVFEPGSTVIFGSDVGVGPRLQFADESTCLFEPVVNTTNIFNGTDLTGTDTVRVIFTGTGVVEFADCARSDLPLNAFVGVQSLPACSITSADVRLRITDSAEFYIGDTDCGVLGGVLQIGNTTAALSPVITFSLILDGPEAKFEVGPQGFFGAGVGIVSKPESGHDSWLIAPTANVQKVSFDLANGIFRHAQLYAGDDDRSALIALSNSVNGSAQPFDFFCDPIPGSSPARYSGPLLSNTSLLGGGNFIAVNSSSAAFNPVVGIINGLINAGQYAAGILASTPITERTTLQNVDAFTLQGFGRAQNVLDTRPTTNRAVAAPSELRHQVRVGYVDTAGFPGEGFIVRVEVRDIIGKTPQTLVQQHTLDLGAAQLVLPIAGTAPRPILSVVEIGN